MFHMPQYVPRSLAANHDVRIFAQEGAPKPCKMPFIAHNTQNKGSGEAGDAPAPAGIAMRRLLHASPCPDGRRHLEKIRGARRGWRNIAHNLGGFKIGAANPPRLCAMFHMPQYVPRSLAAEPRREDLRAGGRAEAGMPFIAHNTQNKGSVEEAPKARLTSPVAMSPPPSITEGEIGR